MKKLFIWLLMSIILQGGIYLYLDLVFLVPSARFSQQSVKEPQKTSVSGLYSHDRAYYARISDTGLKIYSAPDNKLKSEILLKKQESITYFSWLPDRNLALVGISYDTSRSCVVTLKPINMETGSKPVLPKITGLYPGSKIVDVAFSGETNVINILVKYKNNGTVYRTDANNYLRKLRLNTTNIGRIAALKDTVDLFYDDTNTGRVYLLDSKGSRKRLSPDDKGRYALIGVDGSDKIYIGHLSTSKLVDRVLVGAKDEVFRNFKKMDYPYPIDSLKVNFEGELKY